MGTLEHRLQLLHLPHYGPSEERVDNVITGIVYETDELWMFSRPLDTSEPGTHTVACGEPADMLYGVARAGTMDATYNRRIVGVIGGAALGWSASSPEWSWWSSAEEPPVPRSERRPLTSSVTVVAFAVNLLG